MNETESMTEYSIVSVLRHWDIGDVHGLTAIKDGRVYQVDTVDGSFILKNRFTHHPTSEWAAAKLAYEFRLLSHLAQCDVPVAVPLLSQGMSYVEYAGAYYTFCPMVPHQYPEMFLPDSGKNYTMIGEAIGRLHLGLASFPETRPTYSLDFSRRIYQQILPEIAEKHEHDDDGLIAEMLAIEEETRERLGHLALQRIHGDCHPGNICIFAGKVTGFIDCDHLPYGPKFYDLCYYLMHLIAEHCIDSDASTMMFLKYYRQAIDGYRAVHPVTDGDLAAFRHLLLASHLGIYHYLCVVANNREDAKKYRRGFEWVLRHWEQLY